MSIDLSPPSLLAAYSHGLFPMADDEGRVAWYEANPRTILPLDESFRVPRAVARAVRQSRFEIRVDTVFREVIEACAQPAPRRETTWISLEIIEAYCELHAWGFAHSVEAWREGKLVGGLYGVSIGGLFAGESMFTRESNSSKVAIVHLTERLRAGGFVLHDIQMMTPHLRPFGAIIVSRDEYLRRLAEAISAHAEF
ncbi:MAG: leucyl/phenylalanyl-tRNA--protein transferase [Chloroflexi bacterium]|nr:leucyl/phenylalanyl-tRNA--protein transferase [Chloroflexota bacterium]